MKKIQPVQLNKAQTEGIILLPQDVDLKIQHSLQ
jgi:hypothetical protein